MESCKYQISLITEESDEFIKILDLVHHDDFKYKMQLDSPQLIIYQYLFDKLGKDPKSSKLEVVSSQDISNGAIRVFMIEQDSEVAAIYAAGHANINKFMPEFDITPYSSGILLGYFKQLQSDPTPKLVGMMYLTESLNWRGYQDYGKSADLLMTRLYGTKLKKFKELKILSND